MTEDELWEPIDAVLAAAVKLTYDQIRMMSDKRATNFTTIGQAKWFELCRATYSLVVAVYGDDMWIQLQDDFEDLQMNMDDPQLLEGAMAVHDALTALAIRDLVGPGLRQLMYDMFVQPWETVMGPLAVRNDAGHE